MINSLNIPRKNINRLAETLLSFRLLPEQRKPNPNIILIRIIPPNKLQLIPMYPKRLQLANLPLQNHNHLLPHPINGRIPLQILLFQLVKVG